MCMFGDDTPKAQAAKPTPTRNDAAVKSAEEEIAAIGRDKGGRNATILAPLQQNNGRVRLGL
jgi:hypothetical protein